MKLVEIKAWCDNPDHQRGTVEATVERRIKLDDSPAVLLDLCQQCATEQFGPLLRLMRQGTPEETREKRARKPRSEASPEFTCPECGHMSTGNKALSQHARNRHGMSAADLRARTAQS